MINFTGFDYDSFNALLKAFQPVCDDHTPHLRKKGKGYTIKKFGGKPRAVTATMILGLVLTWTRKNGALKNLQFIISMTHSNISMWLRFGMMILVDILSDHPLTAVTLPTDEEVTEYTNVIEKSSLFGNVWGALYGLKLSIQKPGYKEGSNVQQHFYNGWNHEHC